MNGLVKGSAGCCFLLILGLAGCGQQERQETRRLEENNMELEQRNRVLEARNAALEQRIARLEEELALLEEQIEAFTAIEQQMIERESSAREEP